MAMTSKAAASLAGLVTLGAALAGCGGSGSGDGGTTITVWHGYTDVEAKAISAQVKQWNSDHPNDKVRLVLQQRQRQRTAEDDRRLHGRQLPRRRLRVRLLRRAARPPAQAGRPDRHGEEG
jgi:hypothetical protein